MIIYQVNPFIMLPEDENDLLFENHKYQGNNKFNKILMPFYFAGIPNWQTHPSSPCIRNTFIFTQL
jgi:hypothetical protein